MAAMWKSVLPRLLARSLTGLRERTTTGVKEPEGQWKVDGDGPGGWRMLLRVDDLRGSWLLYDFSTLSTKKITFLSLLQRLRTTTGLLDYNRHMLWEYCKTTLTTPWRAFKRRFLGILQRSIFAFFDVFELIRIHDHLHCYALAHSMHWGNELM